MAKVYLETSLLSALVTDRQDLSSAYRRQASLEWWESERQRHVLVVSAEVVAELSHPLFRQSEQALALIDGVPSLPITKEVQGLARILISEKVMPAPLAGDAVHVAVATVHQTDYLLTWNVRHLANPNKVEHLRRICLRVGVVPPQIVTPDLLWEITDEPT